MPASLKNPSKKEPRLNRSERKLQKKRQADLSNFHVSLENVQMEKTPERFFLCLIRGLLIFMAVYGTLGALVSSFGLSYSLPLVFFGLLFFSLSSAFLYFNRLTFYLGYVLVFVGFIVFSAAGYRYINSGFQAFMNEVYNHYSDFFYLSSVREAAELVADRYTTVSLAMLFIGWFFTFLLNIAISGYMNLLLTFLLTFLPLQLAFYVDLVPPLPYLMLLLAVYITVAILGRSGNYTLPYTHKKEEHFTTAYRKSGLRLTYLASSRGMLQTALYAMGFSVFFLLITAGVFSASLKSRYISNGLKDRTDELVKNVVQGGFGSLFNRYGATGGLSAGRLGGVGNISPDFATDLTVRLVPYSSDNIYLKAFTGVTYYDSAFHPYYSKQGADGVMQKLLSEEVIIEKDDYFPILPPRGSGNDAPAGNDKLIGNDELSGNDAPVGNDELPANDKLTGNGNFFGKMQILNLDADTTRNLRPYFSICPATRNTPVKQGISRTLVQRSAMIYPGILQLFSEKLPAAQNALESYEILYLPYSQAINYPDNPSITGEYEQYVYETYTDVPEETLAGIRQFLDESSLGQNLQELLSPGSAALSANDLRKKTLSCAALLKRYFSEEFSYTMAPGNTPRREDFVAYFLNTQKRGFCAHFAASSVLILRSLGIPARYVEGYMIPLSAVMDGTPIQTDTRGWQLDAPKEAAAGVVEVEVTDASAHAWAEIYLKGYGWIPYEFTPPSHEAYAGAFNPLQLFSSLLTPSVRNNRGNTTATDTRTASGLSDALHYVGTAFQSASFLTGPLLFILGLLCLAFAGYALFHIAHQALRIHRCLQKEDYNNALLLQYQKYMSILIRRHSKELFPANSPSLNKPAFFRSLTAREAKVLLSTVTAKTPSTVKTSATSRPDPDSLSAPYSLTDPNSLPDLNSLLDPVNKAAFSPEAITREEYEGFIHRFRLLLRSLKTNKSGRSHRKPLS